MKQRNELSFKGQNIFIGIDVHKQSWYISILVEPYLKRQFVQQPKAEVLKAYLSAEFPDEKRVVWKTKNEVFWFYMPEAHLILSKGTNEIVPYNKNRFFYSIIQVAESVK